MSLGHADVSILFFDECQEKSLQSSDAPSPTQTQQSAIFIPGAPGRIPGNARYPFI